MKRGSNVRQAAIKTSVVAFGLVPCCLIGYLLGLSLLATIPDLFSAAFPLALLECLIMGAFFYGLYALVRWLLGASLRPLAPGLTGGALAMFYFVLLPYGLMIAAHVGLYEPRFNRGMDNYGIAFGFSFLSMPPLVVYAVLATAGWWQRRRFVRQ